ncbi:hypothetical protein GIB67_042114 [Kingdonia uniflora]|uniref:GIL1/IRKI C-terminal domain-containing protein n=1 Tax=Kingdonia uniflora TaxID=39325 RepID=A0A7J7NNK3_9MAGN|nr:hypothetical protein GIB67_042114 [Kingdonia uniflora]
MSYKHHPTPLHKDSPRNNDDHLTVSCNKCRPTSRDKISAVHHQSPTNGLFKSILSSLTKKSPQRKSDASSTTSTSRDTLRDEQWKLAVAELSHKLLQATRKRDEALLEASRLKHSMAELEKKLSKLEIYTHNLQSGLEICNNNSNSNNNSPYQTRKDLSPKNRIQPQPQHANDMVVVEPFINCVSDSRSAVRVLSRSLTAQLRQMGGKVTDRITALLQPYDVHISFTKNPRGILIYLEALLNRTFYEDFETSGFERNGSDHVLNPIEERKVNYRSFTTLQGLTWDEVLNKGTRYFSEEFSRFCDRKMSEIVAMLGWNRAWPEPLLQAFFGAAKSVWLLHLLSSSVRPRLPIFRVEKGIKFERDYMEDMGEDKGKLVPSSVRIMVSPGFYVFANVVKCRVLCRYHNNNNNNNTQGSPVAFH